MKGAWIVAVAVAVAAGAYAGYALARRGGGQSQGGQPSRSSPPSDRRMCPQVMVTCQDGFLAPTPCDCEGRGGVKRVGVPV